MYRNARLLALARTVACAYCGTPGTTVPAHANWLAFGKGKGLKAHDWAVAYLCHHCHNLVDGRDGGLNRQAMQDMWAKAWGQTVGLWFRWVEEGRDPKIVKVCREAIAAIDTRLYEVWIGAELPSLGEQGQ